MAIVKGVRRTRRLIFMGFSAAFGFIMFLVMPSVRVPKDGGVSDHGFGVGTNVAHADYSASPSVITSEGGPGPCPGPGPGCGAG